MCRRCIPQTAPTDSRSGSPASDDEPVSLDVREEYKTEGGGGGNKRVQTHEKGTHLDTGETQEGIRPSGSKETKEARMMARREERLEKERRGPGEQAGRR